VCTSSGQGVTRRARLVLKHDAPNAHDTEAAEAHAVVEALDARLRSIPLPKASAADAPRLTALITAIGMSIVLQNLAMIVWGRQYISFPPLLPNEPHAVLGATVTGTQVIIVVLTLALMGALLLLIHRTRLGRAMRATSQSPALAGLMGVDVNRIILFTFMIGSALAAVAGVMIAGYYGQAHYHMGFMLGLKAFTAAVLGGIGNVSGAMLGGLALGVIESRGAGYIGALTGGFLGSHYQDVFAFAVLILVLVFRPSGLLGERVAERA
jgi:branched-chain amino acid transport system permease protein